MEAVERSASAMASTALAGRAALVTGAGRGLGRGIARALAEAGAEVTLVSRSAGDLEQLAAEIVASGGTAHAAPCDVTDPTGFGEVVDHAGRIDVLVNCAGTNVPQRFIDVTPAVYDSVSALNVRATFFATQAVVRRMLSGGGGGGGGGGGAVVNVTSQMGHVGAADRTVYCSTKHAVEGLTKALAVELAPHGIRVNAVAPTYVETTMTAPFFEDAAFRRDVESRIPIGRIGRVDEITAAVVFLASSAASLITGASLLIDGGYTAQ